VTIGSLSLLLVVGPFRFATTSRHVPVTSRISFEFYTRVQLEGRSRPGASTPGNKARSLAGARSAASGLVSLAGAFQVFVCSNGVRSQTTI
jgi:hypothetical protein